MNLYVVKQPCQNELYNDFLNSWRILTKFRSRTVTMQRPMLYKHKVLQVINEAIMKINTLPTSKLQNAYDAKTPRKLGVAISQTYITRGASVNPILMPIKIDVIYNIFTVDAAYKISQEITADIFIRISPCLLPIYFCRNPPKKHPKGWTIGKKLAERKKLI